jgi:carboxyl-terminal processing protease
VAVIRLTHVIQHSEEALDKAVGKIRRQLGNRLRGVVLDLRNNPGGLLSQSVAIADALLDHGEIVSIRNRRGSRRGFEAEEGDLLRGVPMVVLINRNSASASEIVAGALQDHGRATVLGARSFGKGSVQTITPLDWDGALRLTTSLYYLPSGRSIQGAGIYPDIPILGENEEEAKGEEDQPRALAGPLTQRGPKPVRRPVRARLAEKDCPAAGAKKDDRILGCALVYLKAGSAKNFLSLIGTRRSL